jgi:hypothetical protein
MPHVSPAHHEISKHDSPHDIKIKEVEPPKYHGFKFKLRHVNDSSYSNQGTDHLISHATLIISYTYRAAYKTSTITNYFKSRKILNDNISFSLAPL